MTSGWVLNPSASRALGLVAVATFLSMSVWFSASFVAAQLRLEWGMGAVESSLLTIGVQVGFVAGALTSAATGLADALPGRRLMSIGGAGAAGANLLLLLADGVVGALVARVLTGAFLALVYPPALKEVSTWYRRGRGTALGVMIGALTLGSALPHLVRATGDLDWRTVIVVTSVLAATGAALVLGLSRSGPYGNARSAFSLSGAVASLRKRRVVLANLGYMGHMWELYAMWAWVGVFLAGLPAIARSGRPGTTSALLTFVCIGVGALGCLVGGRLGDRLGRAPSALICLICSGLAALALAVARQAPVAVVVGICVFWGFWVIADSAQFSALVTEHADPAYVGSAISAQLALGYLTTTLTLWLVPVVVAAGSWTWAFVLLALGPLVGSVAMVLFMRPTMDVEASHQA